MNGATILVADDDRAIRVVLDQALGRLGYQVRSTDKAATLWQWIGEGQGDLVITDVVMPDGNGLDLIPSIRKRRPDLRIIAMSAKNTLLTAVRAAERGAFDYLAKPFDLNELIGLVQRALSRAEPAEPRGSGGPCRDPAAHRPLARHAEHLPGHGPADGDRPDGDDLRRIRHRQGAGGPGACTTMASAGAGPSSRSTWRRSRAS